MEVLFAHAFEFPYSFWVRSALTSFPTDTLQSDFSATPHVDAFPLFVVSFSRSLGRMENALFRCARNIFENKNDAKKAWLRLIVSVRCKCSLLIFNLKVSFMIFLYISRACDMLCSFAAKFAHWKIMTNSSEAFCVISVSPFDGTCMYAIVNLDGKLCRKIVPSKHLERSNTLVSTEIPSDVSDFVKLLLNLSQNLICEVF